MNIVFRVFLNLLVAVSLAATPLSASVAAMQTTAEKPESSMSMEPCHESGQVHEAHADTPQAVATKAAEDCCDGDCCCPDNTGCYTNALLSVIAIPAGFTAFPPFSAASLKAALQASFSSLNPVPDSPPPIL